MQNIPEWNYSDGAGIDHPCSAEIIYFTRYKSFPVISLFWLFRNPAKDTRRSCFFTPGKCAIGGTVFNVPSLITGTLMLVRQLVGL